MNTDTVGGRAFFVLIGALAGIAVGFAVTFSAILLLGAPGGDDSLSAQDVARGWAAGETGVAVYIKDSERLPDVEGQEVTRVIVDAPETDGAFAVFVVAVDDGFAVAGTEFLPKG